MITVRYNVYNDLGGLMHLLVTFDCFDPFISEWAGIGTFCFGASIPKASPIANRALDSCPNNHIRSNMVDTRESKVSFRTDDKLVLYRVIFKKVANYC